MKPRDVARFYKDVTVGEEGGRFFVQLDSKPIKTPSREIMTLPTHAFAQAVADEWAGQGEKLDLEYMPLTNLANTANELHDEHRARAIERIAVFGKSDHLCYRAEAPLELIRRQAAQWDPLLDWAAESLDARLNTGKGIAFVEQPPASLRALENAVAAHDAFGLVALHSAATLTGSLVLALAISKGRLNAREAFALARLDDTFQVEKWGLDAAEEVRAARLRVELEAAEQFLRLRAA